MQLKFLVRVFLGLIFTSPSFAAYVVYQTPQDLIQDLLHCRKCGIVYDERYQHSGKREAITSGKREGNVLILFAHGYRIEIHSVLGKTAKKLYRAVFESGKSLDIRGCAKKATQSLQASSQNSQIQNTQDTIANAETSNQLDYHLCTITNSVKVIDTQKLLATPGYRDVHYQNEKTVYLVDLKSLASY